MSTSDELLMAELGSAIEQHDPVPSTAIEAARAAFAWRTFDAEVAELLFDSARDDVVVTPADALWERNTFEERGGQETEGKRQRSKRK